MWCGMLVGWMVWSSDTLYLSLAAAEARFLQKNLLLIAKRLDIQAERALVLQARLWPNPTISLDQMDVFTQAEAPIPPWLSTPRVNQLAFTLSQLVLTAGKRLKGVALAEAAVAVQEAALGELLRQLRYNLYTTLYSLQRDQILMGVFERQSQLLRQLADRYRQLSAQGLAPLPEYLRIENLYLQVQADLREVRQRWEESQMALRELLRPEPFSAILWIDTTGFWQPPLPEVGELDSLLLKVYRRGDVRVAEAQLRLQQSALAVEKALAYPDVAVNVSMDRLGGYRPNQWGVGVALPLPLFNRNQGRIQAARYALEAAQVRYEQTVVTAQSEVIGAWRKLLYLRRQWEEISPDLLERYQRSEALYRENLLASRINFLTYVDFFQSYRDLITRLVETRYLIHQTLNELRYAVGVVE
ncbi:MAG: TolC family protein [Bacteroidia bacterium]